MLEGDQLLVGRKHFLRCLFFDFDQEIYGENVNVIFRQKCRNEIKFGSFDELKKQIEKDVEKSRGFFNDLLN
jgi:riboflavin kinase/FMN adenylyltransferase